jgi:hypothetical protein
MGKVDRLAVGSECRDIGPRAVRQPSLALLLKIVEIEIAVGVVEAVEIELGVEHGAPVGGERRKFSQAEYKLAIVLAVGAYQSDSAPTRPPVTIDDLFPVGRPSRLPAQPAELRQSHA